MLKSHTQRIAASGLFVAIGLILPYFTAHAFAVPGTILLPMHIPVLLCGLICGMRYGAVCGIIIPVLSSVLTGMPAFFPVLPMMIAQLSAMGMISGLLFHKVKLPVYLSLLGSMISGWLLYGLVFAVLLFAGNGELRALSATAAVVQGLPGIAVQLVLIPVLVSAIKRYRSKARKSVPERDDILTQALHLIKNGNVSCVVIQNGAIVHTADGRGVSPLLKLYMNEPEKLKDAFVVDKIIGKAAAMILVLGGTYKAYGKTMSVTAHDYLIKHGIIAQHGRCVDMITNRNQNGICPIERSVLDTDDPKEGVSRIIGAIKELMEQAV